MKFEQTFSLLLIQRWQSIKVHGLAKVMITKSKIQNESKTFVCFPILVLQDSAKMMSDQQVINFIAYLQGSFSNPYFSLS